MVRFIIRPWRIAASISCVRSVPQSTGTRTLAFPYFCFNLFVYKRSICVSLHSGSAKSFLICIRRSHAFERTTIQSTHWQKIHAYLLHISARERQKIESKFIVQDPTHSFSVVCLVLCHDGDWRAQRLTLHNTNPIRTRHCRVHHKKKFEKWWSQSWFAARRNATDSIGQSMGKWVYYKLSAFMKWVFVRFDRTRFFPKQNWMDNNPLIIPFMAWALHIFQFSVRFTRVQFVDAVLRFPTRATQATHSMIVCLSTATPSVLSLWIDLLCVFLDCQPFHFWSNGQGFVCPALIFIVLRVGN